MLAIRCFSVSFFVFISLGVLPNIAHASGSSFYLSPAQGLFKVGQTFSANIYVRAGGNFINAAEATLTFPSDILQVTSISKRNSIFAFWPVEPTHDNRQGTIVFGGGTINSFSGSGGLAASVNFLVKRAGQGNINFSGARILLADGSGTNVFVGSEGARWNFVSEEVVRDQKGAPAALREVPEIVSPTHPDSEKFYSNGNPQFTWALPKGVRAVNFLLNENPDTDPGTSSGDVATSTEYKSIGDGKWYFHLRFKNATGWGEPAHFPINIDTTSPDEFSIQFLYGKEFAERGGRIYFEAKDSFSGIDHYEMKIGEQDWWNLDSWNNGLYILPIHEPGVHNIKIKAVDKAGNMRIAEDLFVVHGTLEERILGFESALLATVGTLFFLIVIIAYLSYQLRCIKNTKSKE